MKLDNPITSIKGIGEKTAQAFYGLGIHTVSDLLYYFPREYQSYKPVENVSSARDNYLIAVCGRICGNMKLVNANGRPLIIGRLMDSSGTIQLRWFNMPYVKNIIKPGDEFVIYGKVHINGSSYCIDQGEYFTPREYTQKLAALRSIYPLTAGITNNLIERTIKKVLADQEIIDELIYDVLPLDVLKKYDLCTRRESLFGIHIPYNVDEMRMARKRLVFEEFVFFILSFRYNRAKYIREPNNFLISETGYVSRLLSCLPFELTNAQKRVWDEIETDLCSNYLMNRLVQGDVGSGKTIIALLAMLKVAQNHGQAALMAPTEVLAFQHYSKITALIKKAGLPVRTVLLTGSMKGFERSVTLDKIERGEAEIIIGTHAIFQEGVKYSNLVLCITDEQHRFGVKQRQALKEKGINTHVLVMSATPIPRTLGMIIYGDLDISIMDEMPANRFPIKNCVVNSSYRPSAYKFLQKQVDEGRQCYVICPMVEESESLDGEDVITYCAKLRKILPSYIRIEYLHGRMRPEDKTAVMNDFSNGQIDILVSTTVIEVGVDVKNATVMMVENAERFGLSALHQLRGRVGRGPYQSYCIFIDGKNNEKSSERLNILSKSNDGFFIASEDLRLRGPGEFLGIKQSGHLNLKIADIYQDSDLLQKAGECVDNILEKDPELVMFENDRLKEHLESYMNRSLIL